MPRIDITTRADSHMKKKSSNRMIVRRRSIGGRR